MVKAIQHIPAAPIEGALTAFDFFAGGGGASYGLHQAGINVLAALNHSPVAIATHEANFPAAKHMLCDIRVQRSWGLVRLSTMSHTLKSGHATLERNMRPIDSGTFKTLSRQTILARAVFPKVATWLPVLALCTPFLSLNTR